MPLYALGDCVPVIHPDAFVHPDAVLIGSVYVDADASVWPGAVLRADYGEIWIGARTSVQDGSVLHTTAQWPTRIAADCVIGHIVHLEGCTIEAHCLVGSGSVVLNRATVRTGSVVAAGAVVREDTEVPPRHLAAGVPASLRPLEGDNHARYIQHAVTSYVENGARFRRELRLVAEPARPAPATI